MGNHGASESEYSSDNLALPEMQDLEEEQEQKTQQEARVVPPTPAPAQPVSTIS